MEQVCNTVLSLPYQDRLQLMHLLLDDLSGEADEKLTESEMQEVDVVLQERLDGPFESIGDVKTWTGERQRQFEARAESLIASGRHG